MRGTRNHRQTDLFVDRVALVFADLVVEGFRSG